MTQSLVQISQTILTARQHKLRRKAQVHLVSVDPPAHEHIQLQARARSESKTPDWHKLSQPAARRS
jgi:hypothetical protein